MTNQQQQFEKMKPRRSYNFLTSEQKQKLFGYDRIGKKVYGYCSFCFSILKSDAFTKESIPFWEKIELTEKELLEKTKNIIPAICIDCQKNPNG